MISSVGISGDILAIATTGKCRAGVVFGQRHSEDNKIHTN